MARALGLLLVAVLIAVFAYLSRFWVFTWWGREGLFGVEWLRAGGDLWRRWMNDLGLGPYDIVLWAVAGFVVLTVLQRLWDRFTSE